MPVNAIDRFAQSQPEVVTTTRLNLSLLKTNAPDTDAKQLTSIRHPQIFQKNPFWTSSGEVGLVFSQVYPFAAAADNSSFPAVFDTQDPGDGLTSPGKTLQGIKVPQGFHVSLFAEFVDKLRSTPDGDGSLLDHSLLLYGAGMSNSNAHAAIDLPIMLVGGASGGLNGGRHLTYAQDTPMANLLVAIMDRMGVPMDAVGRSTGKLDALALV